MKVISKDAAIAGVKYVADEVKPLVGFNVQTMISTVGQRYGFSKIPTVTEAFRVGAKFEHGTFTSNREVALTELGIFNDAVSVTTTDTKDSEEVLNDLVAYLKATYAFRDPTTAPIRAFQSDLIVEFDNDPDNTFKRFAPLQKLLQSEAEKINDSKKPVQFSRIDFGGDPSIPGPGPVFIVERRAGVPWSTNRFFCKAYMETAAHIKALQVFEELLGRK